MASEGGVLICLIVGSYGRGWNGFVRCARWFAVFQGLCNKILVTSGFLWAYLVDWRLGL